MWAMITQLAIGYGDLSATHAHSNFTRLCDEGDPSPCHFNAETGAWNTYDLDDPCFHFDGSDPFDDCAIARKTTHIFLFFWMPCAVLALYAYLSSIARWIMVSLLPASLFTF